MVIRPYGIIIDGALELGLELVIEAGCISEVRPHTGIPEDFVLSPAFVNAHSHLEYRGMMGQIFEADYWPWIRELTRLKAQESSDDVCLWSYKAARENRATGVGLIGEHSDRPVAAAALQSAGITGTIFQEVITFFEQVDPKEKMFSILQKAAQQAVDFSGKVFLALHSPYTVDQETLQSCSKAKEPYSMHLAETTYESSFFKHGTGPIADFYEDASIPSRATGQTVFEYVESLGLISRKAQLIHCCDLSLTEVERLSAAGSTVVHCPRSNRRLGSPPAKIREMLELGISVGLGLDSAASSGEIDMFEEMAEAIRISQQRNAPITAEQAWNMATTLGAETLGEMDWKIAPGSKCPLIKVHVEGASETAYLIQKGGPQKISWLTP